MPDIPFFDPHMHLWDLDRIAYPWLTPPFSDDGVNGSTEAIAKNYLPADYLKDAENWNIIGAVHVEAGAVSGAALAETEWLNGLTSTAGIPNCLVAFADLASSDVERALELQAGRARVRGIRHIVNWHETSYYTYTPSNLLEDLSWQGGFAALQKYGLSFDLQAYPGQFASAARLARRHPGIPIAINHCGMPLMREPGGREAWRTSVAELAAIDHVAIKISGFGLMDHQWTKDSIRPYVLEAIEMFGVNRCMFASNFPTDKLYASFDRVLGAYSDIVSDFSQSEQKSLFCDNAARFYRLNIDF